jgi:uncharacterized repeat protein (TIGR02059 family)
MLMRSILFTILLILSLPVSAATYYVATNGSDSNPGTITQPFATWHKGFTVAQPGDIVYIRGGIYYPEGLLGDGKINGAYVSGKNGSSGKMIKIWAYPGEIPILDGKNMTQKDSHMGIYLKNCSYWHLKGLHIRNIIQTPGHGAHGLWLRSGNNNIFEQLDISFIGGSGLCIVYKAEKNLILNCDVHNCFDQYTVNSDGTPNPGEHADGIDLADITERPGNERVNTIRGVRSWNNSDDGFDHYRVDGVLIIDSCWAWHNGYDYGGNKPTGDGNGFKLGLTTGTPESYSQRTVTNCIAFDNRQRGFSQESANVNMILYNNIAYKNKLQGFAFVMYNRPDILRNNISYRNSSNGTFQSKQIHDHNSWDSGITVSDNDFISLDHTQLMKPRKANGSLPDITFLALAPGSKMIDKGVDVGRAYTGKAPDLGPFETNTSPSISVTGSISYLSSVVENAAPSVLSITWNTNLAAILPAASSFAVTVNSATRTVNSLSISGTKTLLQLTAPVASGDTITVSYTKPEANFLQNTDGIPASTTASQAVTNNVIVTRPVPIYLGAVIQTPTIVQMTYTLALSPVPPPSSSFNVTVDSNPVEVNGVAISGTNVILTLVNPVDAGEEVILDYTVPSSNPIQCTGAGKAEALNDVSVENVLKSAIPEYFSSIIEEPNTLEVTYTADLAGTIPQASAFIAKVNGKSQPVEEVEIAGNKVILTLGANVSKGDIVTIAYVKPAENPLQAISGDNVFTFSDKTVINNVNEEVKLTIYPNPATDFINISNPEPSTEDRVLRIYDFSGKLCMEEQLGSDNTNMIPVDLKSGVYVVQIVTGPLIQHVQKLIVH